MVEIRTAVLAFKMGGISMAKGNSAPDIISLSAGTHTWLDRVPLSFRFFVDGPLASKGSARPGQRVEEIDGLRAWRDLEVRAEALGAALELAGHQVALAPAGEAAHQQPVRGLAAAILAEQPLQRMLGAVHVALLREQRREALKDLEEQLLQGRPLRQEPAGRRIAVEERAGVSRHGALQHGYHVGRSPVTRPAEAALGSVDEAVPVDFPGQLPVERVAGVPVHDVPRAGGGDTEHSPQAVEADVEVVARRWVGVARPQQLHQDLAVHNNLNVCFYGLRRVLG